MIDTPSSIPRIYFVRHGETAWSLSGQHTGRTDLPLTAQGEAGACRLAERLSAVKFNRVFTSPLLRARRTSELAGLGAVAEIDFGAVEWDYGDYEGRRPEDIRMERPGWNIFEDGCPGGEAPGQVSERADRLIARLQKLEGNIAVFSHGQFGRVVGARWIGLPIAHALHFVLSTASISTLGYGHSIRGENAVLSWNCV